MLLETNVLSGETESIEAKKRGRKEQQQIILTYEKKTPLDCF